MTITGSTRPATLADMEKIAGTAMEAIANLYHLIITRGDASMVAIADKVLAERDIKIMLPEEIMPTTKHKGQYDA